MVGCSSSTTTMAAGNVPATFSSFKTCDSRLGFAKSIDFVRVSDLKSMNSARTKVSIIRCSNPGQDIAELQAASEGSPLLGMHAFIASILLLTCFMDFFFLGVVFIFDF